MTNALIYSPGLDGHRQLYVFVLASLLKELDFSICLAYNFTQKISNSFYIDKVKSQHGITLIDTSIYPDGGLKITCTEFLELQKSNRIELTVFAEADHHITLLTSQIPKRANRLKGKSVGIFLRPFYYYHKQGLLDWARYLKHLPSQWRHDTRLFHEVLLRNYSLLSSALYLDEKFVSSHKNTIWLPDVFQQFADKIEWEEKPDQRIWIDRLGKFKEKNKGRVFLLYFGTAQYRRGYDILMKMAEDIDGCFIHCGLRNGNEHFMYDIDKIRSALDTKGRLLETNQYIEDPVCVEAFFKAVNHLVLPYRNFYGSSGVMLQALYYGIPVLAPESGLIGHRIMKHNLGLTFNDKDSKSMLNQFETLSTTDPQEFDLSIQNYMQYQTSEKLKECLIKVFSGTGDILTHP